MIIGMYDYKVVQFNVRNYKTRNDLRLLVVSEFMKEEPGLGGGEQASRYCYYVETLSDGRRIYLTRPAYLKKGFDFRINVEGMRFIAGSNVPKHEDIVKDLRLKRREDSVKAERLYKAISEVYECQDPEDILPKYSHLAFEDGYTVEFILKLVKWFFIEQDIRDWNYSGRQMFMKGVREILL